MAACAPATIRRAGHVVALKADTGALVWSFQLVHHDVWDYDNPAQPSLAAITLDGKARDVVIQGTKQGLIFVLDRDTGKPVLPVEERPAPQGGEFDREDLSPTQPFPADLPPLGRPTICIKPGEDLGAHSHGIAAHAPRRSPRRVARAASAAPSLQGTLVMPFTLVAA